MIGQPTAEFVDRGRTPMANCVAAFAQPPALPILSRSAAFQPALGRRRDVFQKFYRLSAGIFGKSWLSSLLLI